MSREALLSQPFGTLSALIREHARQRPRHPALVEGDRRIAYGDLDRMMDRVAAALARDGVGGGDSVALCAGNSLEYALLFLGALRAGAVAALVPPSATPASIARMTSDAAARLTFDEAALAPGAFDAWLGDARPVEREARVTPQSPFNIIYSSGTTGSPKGIVQPHSMRWIHMQRGPAYGYDEQSVTVVSTPLYSNTTLVSFFPTLAVGGTAVILRKFDVPGFLESAQRSRATHAMLVPVQYQRLLASPDFDRFDLSSFRMKLSTSAPFAAELKREVLRRWPGGLVEYYGMTEGGGTCVLVAHEHRDKLHTVGKPAPGIDLRLIDDQDREVPRGEAGEIVGHSGAMMLGYHNRPDQTARAEWRDATGKRFIRTGDVGRFDDDGFLVLIDRKKDMIISGGFNIYPADIEGVLRTHTAILEAAVTGVPSEKWGETPVAFVVPKPGEVLDTRALLQWVNERVGRIQRVAEVRLLDTLPRNAIGKVMKRELRNGYLDERHRP